MVLSVLEIKLLAANDTSLSSSKTTCSISARSCWELKSKGVSLVLDKPSFLRQHKTDLEQYPLEPTSTAKSSTDHPLDSIVVFKAKYLLVLVLCHDSMFPSQGHVNSVSITFLKTLEKIVISGLS